MISSLQPKPPGIGSPLSRRSRRTTTRFSTSRKLSRLFDPDASHDVSTTAIRLLTTWSPRPREPAPSRVDYVAVINLGLCEDRTDFALWDEPDAYTRRLFEFVGGMQLELPAMRPRIAALLQKHRLSFADGEASDRLSVTDRGRLQRWNAAATQSLRGAGVRLGF